MSTGDDDEAAPLNALYNQVNTNKQDIQTNAEIIQTKATGPEPAINNAIARFVGTDGTTITSSNVIVDDNDNIGIGTLTPMHPVDIRTVGSANTQLHIASTDTDAGGYLTSEGDDSIFISGGSSYDVVNNYVAKSTQSTLFGALFGNFSISSNYLLTPGATFTPTEIFRALSLDTGSLSTGIILAANAGYARFIFPAANFAPPSFNTRSVGTKIVLYPLISSTTADVAIGIDGNVMWFGHFDATAARLFKWYGGTTEVMRLQGDGELLVKAGGASGFAKVGGVVQGTDHYADVNNSGTAETDLYSDTIAANALNTNGDKLTTTYQLVCTGAVAATQQMKVYFGGTAIYDSGALSMGAITSNFTFEVLVVRVSASVVRTSVAVSSDFATLFPYSKYTEVTGLTLSNSQVLKITGTAAGAAGGSNQITAKLSSGVLWYPEG